MRLPFFSFTCTCDQGFVKNATNRCVGKVPLIQIFKIKSHISCWDELIDNMSCLQL